jgi:hypothetical protein
LKQRAHARHLIQGVGTRKWTLDSFFLRPITSVNIALDAALRWQELRANAAALAADSYGDRCLTSWLTSTRFRGFRERPSLRAPKDVEDMRSIHPPRTPFVSVAPRLPRAAPGS